MSGEPSVLLRAVGDIALGDHPLCAGFGTHSRCRRESPGFPFRAVAPLLANADILFGNLECTLSERALRRRDYHSVQMRGHAAYVETLKLAGFDVLNHANNHSMQHGAETFLDTVRMLRQAGIGVCGVAAATYRNAEPLVIERSSLRVAFLGYSLRPRQYFTREPLYAEGYRREILDDLASARRKCDVVIVSLHWGDEFIDCPSREERALAREIIDGGAHLVLGHHPHVLRGVEQYRRGYIVYSLGNFVCDMLWQEQLRETAILECRISAERVTDVRLIPVRIGADYCPIPLVGEQAAALTRRLNTLSAALTPTAQPDTLNVSEYAQAALAAHRAERRSAHRYFLRNAYRFSPGILLQQISTWASNRLAERGFRQDPTRETFDPTSTKSRPAGRL